MNTQINTHELPLRSDGENIFFAAIASAVRWLDSRSSGELIGDDSVGWWLLMEIGKYPPSEVINKLSEKMNVLVAGKPLANGVLYSFTAVARTLKRSGFPLNRIDGIQSTWRRNYDRILNASTLDMNHIWMLQMAAELWPDLAKDYAINTIKLVQYEDPKTLFGAPILIIMKSLGIKIPNESAERMKESIIHIIKNKQIDEMNDWSIAYLLWAMLCCDNKVVARELGEKLLTRQSKGAWDETSEECIESTSLCGLALLNLSMTMLDVIDEEARRGRAIHEVIMLLDKYNWLFHWWQRILNMPKNQNRGWAFESFMEVWISFDKSLTLYAIDLRGGTDEIDVVIDVEQESRFYDLIKSPSILVECKHKTKKSGARDVGAFCFILNKRRVENCKMGIFISTAGFTKDAEDVIRKELGSDQVLISLSGEEINQALLQRVSLSTLVGQKFKEGVIRRPK